MKLVTCRTFHRRLSASRPSFRAQLLCFSAVFTALLPFAPAALAQTTSSFKDLLQGRTAPATIKANQLTKEWRRMRVGSSDDQSIMRGLIVGSGLPSASDQYYSRGETTKVGEETYLIAYVQVPNPADAAKALSSGRPRYAPGEDVPLPDDRLDSTSVLTLSLLNLRTSGNLSDIRAFDPAKDIRKPGEVATANASAAAADSMNNLKQIGLAMLQYTQDYDEKLPPMRTAQSMAQVKSAITDPAKATVQQVLTPYLKDASAFAHPTTRQLYRPNARLSGIPLSLIDDPSGTVFFYEASPDSSGMRAAVYVDGHVGRSTENEWSSIMARSNFYIRRSNRAPKKKAPPQTVIKGNQPPKTKARQRSSRSRLRASRRR